MREYLFLDTSALMQGGQSLVPAYDQMRPGCVVVLSGMVLQELDRQKSGRHLVSPCGGWGSTAHSV